MITVPSATVGVLSGRSWVYRCRIESWLGGVLLDADVPVAAASEEVDRTLQVPESLQLTVPRRRRGVDWTPAGDDHPLAANGQRLRVLLGVGMAGGQTEWLQRGWFVINRSEPRGDSVQVQALGMLSMVAEARLVSPFQPSGTIGSAVRALLEPAVTVDLTDAPTDRAVPAGLNIDEDRLRGAWDLLDAWGADGAINEHGVFVVRASGWDGITSAWISRDTTQIRSDGLSTRDDSYSVVVTRGTAADGGVVQGVAYETTGPKAYGGNFNPLPVPYFYASPLLTTVDQANTAAATVLDRLRRTAWQRYTVTMVPDPRLQAGDAVQLGDGSETDPSWMIEGLSLPYTADGGEMTLSVRGPL